MSNSKSRSAPSSALESPAARQLREGFPWLRFQDTLEQEFQDSLRQQTRWSIYAHLWLGIALVGGFIGMDFFVLNRGSSTPLTWMRLGALAPLLICIALVSRNSLYHRFYPRAVQWMVPLFGMSVVANELLDQPLNVSFFPALVLTVVSVYLLVGLLFYSALRSGLLILAVYILAAEYVRLPLTEIAYNGLILLFTNIVGTTACYTLERLHRTHFLEACLLTDAANRDGLTGISNRRAFDEHIERAWQQAARERTAMALLLIDIDHFKLYNDYYGHQAGDESLKQVARLLGRCCRRPLDCAARYGGEEFAVVLYDAQREHVEAVAKNIQESLAELAIKHQVSPVLKQLTVSIGGACVLPDSERSHFGFVQLADEALYEAKGSGRDRIVIHDTAYADLSTGSFRGRGRPALASGM